MVISREIIEPIRAGGNTGRSEKVFPLRCSVFPIQDRCHFNQISPSPLVVIISVHYYSFWGYPAITIGVITTSRLFLMSGVFSRICGFYSNVYTGIPYGFMFTPRIYLFVLVRAYISNIPPSVVHPHSHTYIWVFIRYWRGNDTIRYSHHPLLSPLHFQ